MIWKNEKRKLSTLSPAKYNPRKMSAKARADLAASLDKFGMADPLVINSNGTIIGGHQRFMILKERGTIDVDVMVPEAELPEAEEKELNVRLNFHKGEWDMELLCNFSEYLLKDIGFDSKELDNVFKLESTEQDDAIPDNVPPVAQRGDLYQLGRHRVMCGDSTDIADVTLLMNGKKADMIFIDPPYAVNYGADQDTLNKKSGNKSKLIARPIIGDNMKAEECAEKIWRPAFKNLYEVAQDHCSFYMTMCQGGDQMMMMMMMMMNEHWQIKHELIWVKSSPVFSMGRLDYDYQHEPILFGWKNKHNWYGGGQFLKSIWEIPKPSKSEEHPTMKPIALMENALLNSSAREEICVDTFCGSGSTLIACEKTSRICMGMEIDPHYTDVIIKRWEDFTGKKAIKI
jgi:DNA modification methylase